tara:strand:+ start:100 stop:240 length:141 start_codon:yes stop_codon:yes gene_type:complete
MKDRFAELLSKENPILEILLIKDKKSSTKLLSKLKKIKKILNKNKR